MTIIKNSCTLSGLQKTSKSQDYNITLVCNWCFPFNSTIGSKHGFIYNLSPPKRSRGKGVHWFDFHLETSPTKLQRECSSTSTDPTFSRHKDPSVSKTSSSHKMKMIIFSINNQVCQWPQTVISPSITKNSYNSYHLQPSVQVSGHLCTATQY